MVVRARLWATYYAIRFKSNIMAPCTKYEENVNVATLR